MPPDLYFFLSLAVKMAVTAGFVVAATVAAERAGPLIGGLVASLPLGAGPVYVFLALDHGADFIGQSAIGSLAINTVNVIFALTYARLAQKHSLPVSLLLSLLVWFALALVANEIDWTPLSAGLLNLLVLPPCILLVRPLRHVPIPPVRTYWYDLALRAGLVALLVGVTVTLSYSIGPAASGILAVFPIILISVILILHRRVGGRATAAVMANAVVGLVGFAGACLMLHYTAGPLGAGIASALARGVSQAWSVNGMSWAGASRARGCAWIPFA